jgi:RNA polymerase sigma-70 factor (ECF subfamily)
MDDPLEAIRGGDAKAWPIYIDQLRPMLLAHLERQMSESLKRKIEPEDILQEVSLEACTVGPQQDWAGREPRAWLFQLCERRMIDAHRRLFAQKRGAEKQVAFDSGSSSRPGFRHLLAASITTPSAAVSRNEQVAQIQTAFGSLTEEQREAIRLRYMENLPSKQIAERMGKTDGAVRVMLARAVKVLQGVMTDSGD